MTDTTATTTGSVAPVTDRYGIPVGATKGDQFSSFDVDAFEVPSHKDEIWRFTPLRRLRGLHDGSAVTADGRLHVSIAERDGVTVETVATTDERVGAAGAPRDRVAAQAFSAVDEATIITVAPETELADPVYVTVDGPGEGALAYGHAQIHLERFANATFVIDQRGGGTIAENVEFIVDDSAHLEVVLIQDWDDDALHLAGHHLLVGRDATVTYTAVTFGGEIVRIAPVVNFTAPGGTATLELHWTGLVIGTLPVGCQRSSRTTATCRLDEANPSVTGSLINVRIGNVTATLTANDFEDSDDSNNSWSWR